MTNLIKRYSITALIITALFSSKFTNADEFDRIGGVIDMDWNDANNWINTSSKPTDEDGIPDEDDEATFGQITLTTDGQVGSINISPLANLTINPGVLQVGRIGDSGFINNQGILTFAFANQNNDEELEIVCDVSLHGGGKVFLVEELNSVISAPLLQGSLHNVDNTICGTGLLDLPIINHGSIVASGGALRINQIINQTNNDGPDGSIEIESDGILELFGGPLTGGTVIGMEGSEIDGSSFGLITGEFTGSTRMYGSGFRNGTNKGTVYVSGPFSADPMICLRESFVNEGSIIYDHGDFSSDHYIRIIGDVDLTGGGEIVLTDRDDSIMEPSIETASLNNIDNTIRGTGWIRLVINNLATVRPEDGQLRISEDIYNDSGTIELPVGGHLLGNGQRNVFGGTIVGQGGELGNVNLLDTTLTGTVLNNSIGIGGTIINTGTLLSNEVAFDSDLRIIGTTTLIGGGEVVLVDLFDSLIFGDDEAHLINVDNTIRGRSVIRIPITNRSLIRAESGLFRLESDIDNNNGRFEIAADTQVLVDDGEISGGVVAGEPGAHMAGPLFHDCTFEGELDFYRNSFSESGCTIDGTIVNNARLSFESESDLEHIFISQTVNLSGDGEIVLVNSSDVIRSFNQNGSKLINTNHLIRGSGLIDVDFCNSGEVFADSAIGSINYLREVSLSDTSKLSVKLDGPNFAQSGLHVFDEPLVINGELRLDVGESFEASIGDRYTVLTAPDFLDSQFDNYTQTSAIANETIYVFDVQYRDDKIDVVVAEILVPGDINGDGTVDLTDVQPFVEAISSGNYLPQADLNGDGEVNLLDVQIFVALLSGG